MIDAFAQFDSGNTVGGAAATGILTGAQFAAGVVGTYTSTKSYDTAAVGLPAASVSFGASGGGPIGGPLIHDLGRGRRLNFDARITAAVTSAGAATVQVNFICADDGPLTVNPQALLLSEVVGKALLVIGYRYRHGHTPGVVPRRFVGAQVVIGTANLTAGTYSSGLMLDQEDHADILG